MCVEESVHVIFDESTIIKNPTSACDTFMEELISIQRDSLVEKDIEVHYAQDEVNAEKGGKGESSPPLWSSKFDGYQQVSQDKPLRHIVPVFLKRIEEGLAGSPSHLIHLRI